MKIKLIVLVTLASLFIMGCNKQSSPNQTSQPAKPANASPTAKPVKDKKPVQPASTTATGSIYSHPEAGIQFEVPPSWTAEIDGEVMTVTAADNSISIALWVPKEADVEAAAKAIDAELAKMMTNIKTNGEGEESTLNGMETYNVGGTGDIEGVTLNWSAHIIAANKPVFVVAFAAPGVWEQHQKELTAFTSSIKKGS
ncbi:MAG TPA: hypothetical protein VID27_14545 [Blastocatellia bacterium]|jgi:hypothetical protein